MMANRQPTQVQQQTRRPKLNSLTVTEEQRAEVLWYRTHGRHKDRVVRDRLGREYVQCDFIWNHNNPLRVECVKRPIANFIYQRTTGISE